MVRPRAASRNRNKANVIAASMYQTSEWSIELRATMGIRAHPGLTSGKTSKSQISAKPEECAGQTVRPSR